MKFKKIFVGIFVLLILMMNVSYSLGYSYKSQMADMAKNYAEKTYGREFKIESVNFGGLQVILGAYESTGWFTSKKLYECGVDIADVVYGDNAKNNINRSVPNIAGRYNVVRSGCGEVIVNNKQIELIKREFVNNYYKNVSISSGMTPGNIYGPIISENRVEKQKGSFYPTCSNNIVNNMWQKDFNLPIKKWLSKYKDCLAVDNIIINIYEQPENAENIAKAMEFAYKLDKYLRSLTTSHKINGIYIYMTDLTLKKFNKEGGLGSNRRKNRKEYPRGKFNFYFSLIDARYLLYVPQDVKDIGKVYENKLLTNSNIFEFVRLTNSNRSDMSFIKETKYYQSVKKILDSKLNKK